MQEEALTHFELFLLLLPLGIIAVFGSYWVIRYNDSLPIPPYNEPPEEIEDFEDHEDYDECQEHYDD